jgi:hypothetical protein
MYNAPPLFEVSQISNLLKTKELQIKSPEEALFFHLHALGSFQKICYQVHGFNGAPPSDKAPIPLHQSRYFKNFNHLEQFCIDLPENHDATAYSQETSLFPPAATQIVLIPLTVFSVPFGWLCWHLEKGDDPYRLVRRLFYPLAKLSTQAMVNDLLNHFTPATIPNFGNEEHDFIMQFAERLAPWFMPQSFDLVSASGERNTTEYHGFHSKSPKTFTLNLTNGYCIEYKMASMILPFDTGQHTVIHELVSFQPREAMLKNQLDRLFALFHLIWAWSTGTTASQAAALRQASLRLNATGAAVAEMKKMAGQYEILCAELNLALKAFARNTSTRPHQFAFYETDHGWEIFFKGERVHRDGTKTKGLRVIQILLQNPGVEKLPHQIYNFKTKVAPGNQSDIMDVIESTSTESLTNEIPSREELDNNLRLTLTGISESKDLKEKFETWSYIIEFFAKSYMGLGDYKTGKKLLNEANQAMDEIREEIAANDPDTDDMNFVEQNSNGIFQARAGKRERKFNTFKKSFEHALESLKNTELVEHLKKVLDVHESRAIYDPSKDTRINIEWEWPTS